MKIVTQKRIAKLLETEKGRQQLATEMAPQIEAAMGHHLRAMKPGETMTDYLKRFSKRTD